MSALDDEASRRGGEADAAAAAAGFIDARARREYVQLALGAFLISFMYSHAALLAVVFAREGFDLHATGLLLSSYAFR